MTTFDDYCECACHRNVEDGDPSPGWCDCGCPLDDNGKCMGIPPCEMSAGAREVCDE